MSNQLPKTLTSSISGVIRPGACVNIPAMEEFTVPTKVIGVLGIRQSIAKKSVTLGASLIPSGWHGKPNIQLINHGEEEIEVKAGDELANIAFLVEFVEE